MFRFQSITNILGKIKVLKDRLDFASNHTKALSSQGLEEKKGQTTMPEGYGRDGQRLNGGGQLAFLNQQYVDKLYEKTALDNAIAAAIPSDDELHSSVKTYHQHMRSIVDSHIKECIALRDGSSGPNGQPGQDRFVPVVERLQELREHMFGTKYEEPYEEIEDVLLSTHEKLSEDQEESEDEPEGEPEEEVDGDEGDEEDSSATPSLHQPSPQQQQQNPQRYQPPFNKKNKGGRR